MKIQYVKKYVCYIDILGFREMVTQYHPQTIYNIIQIGLNEFRGGRVLTSGNPTYAIDGEGIDFFYFSDTFVLMFSENLPRFPLIIGSLITKLISNLQYPILVRGSVTYGDVYYNKQDNILYGPAFVQAYELEKQAKLPRIIIDKNIASHLISKNCTRDNNLIECDSDGWHYIKYHFDNPFSGCPMAVLSQLYSKYKNNPSISDKYRWLVQKYNEQTWDRNNPINL